MSIENILIVALKCIFCRVNGRYYFVLFAKKLLMYIFPCYIFKKPPCAEHPFHRGGNQGHPRCVVQVVGGGKIADGLTWCQNWSTHPFTKWWLEVLEFIEKYVAAIVEQADLLTLHLLSLFYPLPFYPRKCKSSTWTDLGEKFIILSKWTSG